VAIGTKGGGILRRRKTGKALDGVLAKFGEKNLPDALATALLLQIEEELGRKEGLSNGN